MVSKNAIQTSHKYYQPPGTEESTCACLSSYSSVLDAFGPDCKKAVFNGMFRNTVSSKTHLGDFASMELCVAAGLESDLGIQAVMWISGGRCLGYYDTNAHALFKLPLTMPMASFVCIIDEQMAENYMSEYI